VEFASAPIIETDRLRLRGHRVDDLAGCAAMWNDPVVTRYISSGKRMSQQDAWFRLLRYAGHWALLGFGYWALEEKRTGAFIGDLGFADHKRDIDLGNLPELGWALVSTAHGKGYATEAVRAALAWGDTHFTSARTVCVIDPQNLASIHVAEKCGYKEIARPDFNEKPIILMARDRTTS
jgi:RimJ/RimL family protein N-acetyltransferase